MVATLWKLGVGYIVVEQGVEPYDDVPPDQFLTAVLRDESVRVQYAVIPLFMRHPRFADVVPSLVAALPEAHAQLLRRHYTAAVYLQRMFQPALEVYLGPMTLLPDHFSAEVNLPSPDEYFGEIGLRELVSRLPPPINWWESYLNPVEYFLRLVLASEKAYGSTYD